MYVCASAVPLGWTVSKLNDSKKLTPQKREEVFYFLNVNKGLRFEVVSADVEEIDREGLGSALKRCYVDALAKLRSEFPEALIVVDGEVRLSGFDYIHFPRADGHVPAVMAASIYGKVLRDRFMATVAAQHPGYGLGDHMGYGTPAHEKALKEKGMSPVHRNYTPMERILTGKRASRKTAFTGFDDDVEMI